MKVYSVLNTIQLVFLSQMATLKNKRKLATVNIGHHEEYPRNNSSRDTNVPTVSTRGLHNSSRGRKRVTKKSLRSLGQSRILRALWKLDNFLSSQVRVQSGTFPETHWNYDVENPKYDEDSSQNDAHPEVGVLVHRSPHYEFRPSRSITW